jgi:hypothetical protein
MNSWIACAVAFNQEHFIRAWVANAVSYADVVLVMYSPRPWTYNPAARRRFKPDRTGTILAELERQYPKLTVIRGDWEDETSERTEALRIARCLGGRYLLIVDCDEFYAQADVERAKRYIEDHPAGVWLMPHIQLIKCDHWGIRTAEGLPRFQFVVDVDRVRRFRDKRTPESDEVAAIPEDMCTCYHYSYCLPYAKLVEKLGTFGHAREIRKHWLRRVWPTIRPGATDFHPVCPAGWKAVFEVQTPPEIADLFGGRYATPERGWRLWQQKMAALVARCGI